ncbi:MAG: replication-associated recombination protein A [Elusimicrobiota bacterium]
MEKELFDKECREGEYVNPLALRLSPKTLDDFVGQDDILGEGKLLRRAILADKISSLILYGPSGVGKSSIARIIAARTTARFVELNAVSVGVQELRDRIEDAKKYFRAIGKKTILLLDEIHHFNRTQQDALLPDVEKGNITLIGITTENPYFYVNSALLSRSMVFEFKKLAYRDIKKILKRVMEVISAEFGNTRTVILTEEAMEHISKVADGDARKAINAIEIGVYTTPVNKNNEVVYDIRVAEESIQKKVLRYDKKSDEHYDTISAYIKSIRGSDPDAAVYWLAKMLYAGEDPRFVARRLIIACSEDIGNADPQSLVLAVAALNAIEFVGMPEARIILSHATIYASCAPKSNASYMAINDAMKDVEQNGTLDVPDHLRDASLDSETRGHGVGYKYPHDFPANWVAQKYLPVEKVFYNPGINGYEKVLKDRVQKWRDEKKAVFLRQNGKRGNGRVTGEKSF